jgi:hypothetical protein
MPTELTAPISEDLANNDKQIALTVTTHAPGQPIPVIQPVVLEIPTPGPIPSPIPIPLLQGAFCGECDMGIGLANLKHKRLELITSAVLKPD